MHNRKISLNQKIALIGFRIYFPAVEQPIHQRFLQEADLEKTLAHAAYEAQSDFRILAVLLSWISGAR